jgi:hypothetical protein
LKSKYVLTDDHYRNNELNLNHQKFKKNVMKEDEAIAKLQDMSFSSTNSTSYNLYSIAPFPTLSIQEKTLVSQPIATTKKPKKSNSSGPKKSSNSEFYS